MSTRPDGIPSVVTSFLQSSLYTIKHHVPSAWTGHIPFMFGLMRVLRPKVYVELGVHNGASFFAACQSVVQESLSTRCIAIDHWEGDPHAGIHDLDTFQAFARTMNSHYSGFAAYIKATFDEALRHVDDAEVDLLHLDGFHTYEAVKHDFESWAPKLSDGAVVMLHDINEYRGSFGAWRFWKELENRYPNRTLFLGNDHGLGVVFLGGNQREEVRTLLGWLSTPANTSFFQQHFSTLSEFQRRSITGSNRITETLASVEKSNTDLKHTLEATRETLATVQSVLNRPLVQKLLGLVHLLDISAGKRRNSPRLKLARLEKDKKKVPAMAAGRSQGC